MGKAIERVLIYRLGSLGDTVVALPCLHLIERAYPGAERRMLTNFPVAAKAAPAAAVLDGSGLVAGYFEYPVQSRNVLVLAKLWWRLFRWRPQVVVYLAAARGVAAARRDARYFGLLGGAQLVGFPLTQTMQDNLPADGVVERECARLARNLAEVGDARLDDGESWDLRLTSAERERASEALSKAEGRPMVMVSLGTKRQTNDWGRERWRELMFELGKVYGQHALVLTGVAEEREASDFVGEGWYAGAGADALAINLCGALTPRQSAACYERAVVFLGHDSGPMHLAAAVGTPVVAVFSSRNLPGKWFPPGLQDQVLYHAVDCMGCGLAECVVERKKCISSIAVIEVLAAVRAVLG